LQALESDYRSAIDGYESAADKAQNNNLLAWNIKNYLFQAGICHLATGVSIFPFLPTCPPPPTYLF